MTIEYTINPVRGSSKINIEFKETKHKYGTMPFSHSGAIRNPGTIDDLKNLIDIVETRYKQYKERTNE